MVTVNELILTLHPNSATNFIRPHLLMSYGRFRNKFGRESDKNEVQTLQKFYGARRLMGKGCLKNYVNVELCEKVGYYFKPVLKADVCGDFGSNYEVVLCETSEPDNKLRSKLQKIEYAENVNGLILFPNYVEINRVERAFQSSFNSGKLSFEFYSWISDELSDLFSEALELVDMLGNKTRMKMLMQLLEEPKMKSQYRKSFNPKLVYQNIKQLLGYELIIETEKNKYQLTPVGTQIVGEYITFVHKVKETLEKARIEDRR